jgi:hypothetical protein
MQTTELKGEVRGNLLSQLLQIILDQIIEAWGPKLHSKELGKSSEVIQLGFGCAVMLLEADPDTDDFLKRSAAKLNRNAQENPKRKHLLKH